MVDFEAAEGRVRTPASTGSSSATSPDDRSHPRAFRWWWAWWVCYAPWVPTPETELVEVYDRYDIPLSGLLEQDDDLYFFECKLGRDGAEHMAYSLVAVTQPDVDDLEDSVDFDAALARLTAGRPSLAVFYSDERGIFGTVLIESPASYENCYSALSDALQATQNVVGTLFATPPESDRVST